MLGGRGPPPPPSSDFLGEGGTGMPWRPRRAGLGLTAGVVVKEQDHMPMSPRECGGGPGQGRRRADRGLPGATVCRKRAPSFRWFASGVLPKPPINRWARGSDVSTALSQQGTPVPPSSSPMSAVLVQREGGLLSAEVVPSCSVHC